MKYKMYLSSPIFNTKLEEANNWKKLFKEEFKEEFIVIDPYEEVEYVDGMDVSYLIHTDKLNLQKSNLVISNCWKPSFGTPMELLYAWERGITTYSIYLGKPIHPWIKYHSTKVFKTPEDCILGVKTIFLNKENN